MKAPEGYSPGTYEIETFTGAFVDLMAPLAETIDFEDVAVSLSRECRYANMPLRTYSVAEHAVLVARKLITEGHEDLALAGLHHDDAEAYLGDQTRPHKMALDVMAAEDCSHRDLSDRLDRAIFLALSPYDPDQPTWLPHMFEDPLLKAADAWALMGEARHLLPSKGKYWNVSDWSVDIPWEPIGDRWPCAGPGLSTPQAYAVYVHLHKQLVAGDLSDGSAILRSVPDHGGS